MTAARPRLLVTVCSLTALFCVYAYHTSLLQTIATIISLPLTWSRDTSNPTSSFLISTTRDSFDVTFASYPTNQSTASLPSDEHQYEDLVPSILHQIALGHSSKDAGWSEARNACLNHHVGWENKFWTDDNAGKFVREKFPHLVDMWEGYPYPIQRVDALRYMVLFEYGGAILDMDLHCRRSLGPLRRFAFVAPAAHPVGFSNGMMMAAPAHPFVAALLHNLPIFNRNWLLPYATVMFTTGCHYASSIHALQPASMRAQLRILAGTPSAPTLHALNGDAVTPLFHHLGASSWHSYDAFLINKIGHLEMPSLAFTAVGIVLVCLVVVASWLRVRLWRMRGRSRSRGRRGLEFRERSRPGTPLSSRGGAEELKSA